MRPTSRWAACPSTYFGTEEQKQEYLPQLCSGESIGSFGLTEPEAGSDAGGTKTTAVLEDGEWVINGGKCFITNASYAKFVTITAVTDKGMGTRGISDIIVPTDAPGFTVRAGYEKMGLHGSNTTELSFDNVRVPEKNLVGKRGEGFKQFLVVLDGGRIAIGAMGVGIAQACLGRLSQVRQGARAVRPAHRQVPGHPVQAGRHGHEHRTGPQLMYLKAAWLKDRAGRTPQRPTTPSSSAVGDVHQGGAGGHPDPRRLRLHEGVPRGALPARLQAAGDRRGHLGGHPAGDREGSGAVRPGGSRAAGS